MRQVYADTVYWIALANPLDQWHPSAVRAGYNLRGTTIITSEEILVEFLAHFSGQGRTMGETAARYSGLAPLRHAPFPGKQEVAVQEGLDDDFWQVCHE